MSSALMTPRLLRGGFALTFLVSVLALSSTAVDVSAAGWVLATSSSSQAYQRPAQDKVAYLHDGSLLVGYFNGSRGVIDQVKNPSTSPSAQQVQTISGDEVTLYTQPGSGSTDIWIQVGAELVGSAPLEQIQHGIYDGSSFTWDAATAIPGTVSPGRQDPSVTWTGKWLIATWWDDTNLSNSDNVFMNWTADRTGTTGWLSTAIHMTTTNQNITQPNIRHSAKLGATVLVYGTHYRDLFRVLPDGRTDPGLANWTAETMVDPGYDDSEAGFGGPQVAIDESTGKIHVFRAVLNAGGTWHGVTYWLGTPDATPMVTGSVTWNPRLIIDAAASPTPVDIAGAVDSSGKVYVFWVTSASSGAIKYATLTSPYTSASAATTLATTGTQPRYPHIPAQAPLSRGYVPILYQTGAGSPYSIVLDTTILAGGADTSPPTVPTGLTATASTTAPRVDLAWSASTDNVAATGYTVYRNGSLLTTVSGSTPAYADNTVSSLTTYSYAVDAFDAAGNHSARSALVSVTTPDTSPPTVPAGLLANAISPGEIDLDWNASVDNVGVTGYTVFRNGSFLAAAGAGVTTLADTTVVASTTYSYTVDAFDAAGNHSARSAPASATTPGTPDTQAPTVPAGVTARVGTTVGEVDVAWNAATDNVGVTGYTIYRDGTALGTVSGSTVTYADHSTAGLSTYSYTVDAFDAAVNHSAQSPGASVTTPDWTPPTVPAGLTATLISNDEIDLSWNASTDNVGVTGYTVYRNGAAIATTAGLSYANTGLGHGFAYTYTVDAIDAAGNHSALSAPASATTLDDFPPTTPGTFAAAGTSPTAVAVSWSASTDNVAVTGYGVYRDSTLLITLGASALSYTDTVAAGSTHSYTVDAFDAAGNHSGRPTPISVTTSTAVSVPKFIQGAVTTTGSRVTSATLAFGPVAQGDLLVGWFGQYDSAGQVNVSDNVHGAWTRSASTTWRGGTTPGDIALYYLANAGAAPSGITITITSSGATYLQAAASEYSGISAVNPLDQVVVAKGSGTTAASGLTAAVGPGELVYAGMSATNNAGTLTPGTSQGVTFVKRLQSSGGTQSEEDIVAGAAGQQQAMFSFGTSVPWFIVCAVFKPAGT
jgi:fibronectin type 3 domain-containing protein